MGGDVEKLTGLDTTTINDLPTTTNPSNTASGLITWPRRFHDPLRQPSPDFLSEIFAYNPASNHGPLAILGQSQLLHLDGASVWRLI